MTQFLVIGNPVDFAISIMGYPETCTPALSLPCEGLTTPVESPPNLLLAPKLVPAHFDKLTARLSSPFHPYPGIRTIASTSTRYSGRTKPATMTVELAGGLLGQVSERTLP